MIKNPKKSRKAFLYAVLSLCGLLGLASPVHAVPDSSANSSLMTDCCFLWLRFYQKVLNRMITVRCPMEPSCSNYSLQAIQKHGPFKGVILTADRLIHEADEQEIAVQVIRQNHVRFLDPVENNDFWWYKP